MVEPRGWWANVPLLRRWVGVLPQLSIDRMNTVAGPAWLEALRSDAVWYWIFNRDIYHLRDPDDMAEVARRVEDFAPPGANNKTLKIFLGDSLVIAFGVWESDSLSVISTHVPLATATHPSPSLSLSLPSLTPTPH